MIPGVTLWHRDFLPEDVHDGDIDAESYSEVTEVNGVEEAADILLRHGLVEINDPTSYYDPDGSSILNYYTGERRESSGHLHGFSTSGASPTSYVSAGTAPGDRLPLPRVRGAGP
jgi:hypothetical protein